MAQASKNKLLVEREGHVVTLTFNRPERRNAITMSMFAALKSAVEDIARDPDARGVVLRGADGSFSSGADLTPSEASETRGRPDVSPAATSTALIGVEVNTAILALHRLAKPTIACVEGIAAGAGANVAFCCDLVFAAEDARFSQIFVKRGLSLDCGGTWLLPRLVGLQKAKELAFYGDWLSAPEALALGLVTRVWPAAELADRVGEWAARLARQAPVAVSIIKQSLDRSMNLTMAEALDQEAVAQGVCTSTLDFREAMRAFAEKRAPKWRGR